MIINFYSLSSGGSQANNIRKHIFYISETDYNLILANPELLQVQYPLRKNFVSAEIYSSTLSYEFDISPMINVPLTHWWGIRTEVGTPNQYQIILADTWNNFYIFDASLITNFELVPPTSPTSTLTFNAVAGISSADHQDVFITASGTITHSSSVNWLNISHTVAGSTVRIVILPNNTISAVGQHTGIVTIFENGVQILTINVIYNIEDYVQAPNGLSQFFTLEPDFFKFQTANQNTYFQLDVEGYVYEFLNLATKMFNINQKLIPFDGHCKVNLGKTIHRLMGVFPAPNNNSSQYVPAVFYFNIKEINFATGLIIRELNSNQFSYIAGLDRNPTIFGFLNFNHKPSRVTTNSVGLLNYYVEHETHSLRVSINGLSNVPMLLPNLIQYIQTLYFNFDSQVPGDVVIYDILDSNNDVVSSKKYCVFPAGKYSNTITWENEFLLQTKLECTGTFNITSDFEFQTQKTYQNLVEQIEILDTTKENKLTINTGWLLATDVDDIESLMRAKRVWIGPENIALRPIGKKMINQDSERELIEFTLEFTINRETNEKTYSL